MLVECVNQESVPRAVDIDKASRTYGWVFCKHPDGNWVTLRKASSEELERAEKFSGQQRKEPKMEISKKALELCWEIEKLPASEQQTKISQMANELRKEIENFAQPKLLCPKCGGADIGDSK